MKTNMFIQQGPHKLPPIKWRCIPYNTTGVRPEQVKHVPSAEHFNDRLKTTLRRQIAFNAATTSQTLTFAAFCFLFLFFPHVIQYMRASIVSPDIRYDFDVSVPCTM